MMKLENQKYTISRVIIAVSCLLLIAMLQMFFYSGSAMSSFGPPMLFPFVLIGIPFLFTITIADIINLKLENKLTSFKIAFNIICLLLIILICILIITK